MTPEKELYVADAELRAMRTRFADALSLLHLAEHARELALQRFLESLEAPPVAARAVPSAEIAAHPHLSLAARDYVPRELLGDGPCRCESCEGHITGFPCVNEVSR